MNKILLAFYWVVSMFVMGFTNDSLISRPVDTDTLWINGGCVVDAPISFHYCNALVLGEPDTLLLRGYFEDLRKDTGYIGLKFYINDSQSTVGTSILLEQSGKIEGINVKFDSVYRVFSNVTSSTEKYFKLKISCRNADIEDSVVLFLGNHPTGATENLGSSSEMVDMVAKPNPFNPITMITFSVTKRMKIKLALYDLAGRRVMMIKEGFADAGQHIMKLNAVTLPGGMYCLRLEGEGLMMTRRITLMK
ncbi:MAG: T9SS type A sorting domain-containing protein [Fibrobacteres bacterium]|nr:T9SS type A sorting domain-containing protein [Fibrobacterota bacterium]